MKWITVIGWENNLYMLNKIFLKYILYFIGIPHPFPACPITVRCRRGFFAEGQKWVAGSTGRRNTGNQRTASSY